MRPKIFLLILHAAFICFLSAITPGAVTATELIVDKNHPADTTHYTTIQDAVTYAEQVLSTQTGTGLQTFSITIEPGTYSESITLSANIPIRGRETASTFIDGLITANTNTINDLLIKNLTFINAGSGIVVSNSATLHIKNNVFVNCSTAVKIQGSQATDVVNNTFSANTTAISKDSDLTVTNNIFSGNTSVFNLPQAASTKATGNLYHNNSSIGITPDSASIQNQDPLFVDPADHDFHLKTGSPGIKSGGTDLGAYGGTEADTIPFRVSGVAATLTTSTSIAVNWNANNSYTVKGYNVYYGNVSRGYSGTGATEGASPITVPTATAASLTLTGLSATAVTPPVPTLDQPTPLNESLNLTWTAVTGATGYKVYYGTTNPPTIPIDVQNVTTYTLTGLTNGQTYYVALSAYDQATYYIAVTALNVISSTTTSPGSSNESAYSTEATAGSGDLKESGLSNVVQDFPEASKPYPDLPNGQQGCFIATAAYGYYGAPSVQALRVFRDRYLLTNRMGSAFVEWYYRVSPRAAAYLNAHPGYKPLVRAGLMPLVGISLILAKTSLALPLALLTIVGGALLYFFRRSVFGPGGAR